MRVDNNNQSVSPKKTIHIVHILDKSSSMQGGKMKSALSGINAEIKDLKKSNDVEYLFSLVAFSYGFNIRKVYWQMPINQVDTVDIVPNGNTALYQAIGETLEDFPQDNPVLVKIFTDGEENDSRGKYSSAENVKRLIEKLEQKDFTITFVGTERDVKNIQHKLSISDGNTLSHDNTAEGVADSFRKSIDATLFYSNSVSKGEFTKTMSFYNND